jgi:hypothetical protein
MIHIMPDQDFGDHHGVEAAAAKVKAAKVAAKGLEDIGPLKATSNFSAFDTNGDGIITADDCPFDHGSPAAGAWWKNVQDAYLRATVHHPDALQFAKYGDKFHGFYNGKPLLSGVSAQEVPGQGDFDYVTDRVMVTQGLSKGSAQNIAGFIKAKLGR